MRKRFFFADDPEFWLSKSRPLSASGADFYPALILLLRSWSGEFSNAQVLALRQRFPLAPILAILGSWCEGEARNGSPLSGVHALSWFDFCAMSPLETFALENGWASVWSLPPEALPEQRGLFEILREEKQKIANVKNGFKAEKSLDAKNEGKAEKSLNAGNSPSAEASSSLEIRIESDDFDQFIFLRDFCLRTFSNGVSCRIRGSWLNDPLPAIEEKMKNDRQKMKRPDFVFFDFPDFSQATIQKLYAIKKHFSQSIVVAFTEFPRVEEWRFLKKNGVHAMFPKPFRLADLEFFCSQQIKIRWLQTRLLQTPQTQTSISTNG